MQPISAGILLILSPSPLLCKILFGYFSFLPPHFHFLPLVLFPSLLPSGDPAVWALQFFMVHWLFFAGLHSSTSNKDCKEGSKGCGKEFTSDMLQTVLKCVCNLTRWMDSPCAAGDLESRFKVIHTRGWGGGWRGRMSNFHTFP